VFTADNTNERILSAQHEPISNKNDKCSIYYLTCPTCKRKYTGQTADPLTPGFRNTYRILNMGTINGNLRNTY
jgi:hypothetical protein